MPRRRPVNGPTVTSLLTRVVPTFYTPATPAPPRQPAIYARSLPLASGQPITGLTAFAPALPAQFATRTLPAVSGILQANAANAIGGATDAAIRGWQVVRDRIFGTSAAESK